MFQRGDNIPGQKILPCNRLSETIPNKFLVIWSCHKLSFTCRVQHSPYNRLEMKILKTYQKVHMVEIPYALLR